MAEFTKHALSRSLVELLKVKRLDKITIQEIVDGAGVNRQTFYYHFADIFDIARYTVLNYYNALLKKYGIDGSIIDPDPLRFFLSMVTDHKRITLNIYKGMDESHLRRSLHEIVDPEIEKQVRAIAGGRLSPADIKFAVAFYSSGYYGIFLEWLNDDLDESNKSRMEKMLPVLEESLQLLVARLIENRSF